MTDSAKRPSGPRAVARVLDLFSILASRGEGMTLAQLSAELSVAKPTLLETLRGLCEQHYLVHHDGRYRLGSQAYRLASKMMAAWSPPQSIRHEVSRLAALTSESVGFAIADWQLGQVIYTEAVNSSQLVRYAMRPGIRAPLYASAAGRVMLAFSSGHNTEGYLARTSFRRLTESTRATIDEIRADLAKIRQNGYCASFGEMLPDTAAIAAPVFGRQGNAIGALMIAGPLQRIEPQAERLIEELLTASRHASGASQDEREPPRAYSENA